MRIREFFNNAAAVLCLSAVVAVPCTSYAQGAPGYKVTRLVSDQAQTAVRRDRNLVNPWGLAASPTGPWWVANEETGLMTAYDKNGRPIRSDGSRVLVFVPGAGDSRGTGRPSGLVSNKTQDFIVTAGDRAAPALFITAGTDGVVNGWNPAVNTVSSLVILDNSQSGAEYTGITIATRGNENVLAVANFAKGVVDIYNSKLELVATASDPNADVGFSPFNVTNLDGLLFVTYALRNDEGEDEPGPGLGLVDVFDTNGTLVRRFAEHGTLNAPWGVVRAPADFGAFSGDVLIGNFGDGTINAFDPATGDFKGMLTTTRGEPITIEGLWGLAFGNGGSAGRTNVLYFTAGLDDETHGLFGKVVSRPAGGN